MWWWTNELVSRVIVAQAEDGNGWDGMGWDGSARLIHQLPPFTLHPSTLSSLRPFLQFHLFKPFIPGRYLAHSVQVLLMTFFNGWDGSLKLIWLIMRGSVTV